METAHWVCPLYRLRQDFFLLEGIREKNLKLPEVNEVNLPKQMLFDLVILNVLKRQHHFLLFYLFVVYSHSQVLGDLQYKKIRVHSFI